VSSGRHPGTGAQADELGNAIDGSLRLIEQASPVHFLRLGNVPRLEGLENLRLARRLVILPRYRHELLVEAAAEVAGVLCDFLPGPVTPGPGASPRVAEV
jgi:hypothetical protein